jgi:hypothetical protein
MARKPGLTLIVSVLLLAACSKDKKTIASIEGTWSETEINGTPVSLQAQDKIEFTRCRNRDKEICDCIITDASGVVAGTLDYEIDDDGKSLVIIYHYNTITTSVKHTILELDGDHMKIEWNGPGYVGTYARQ